MEHQTHLSLGDCQERKITRMIEVKLTNTDYATMGQEVGQIRKSLDALEAEYSPIKEKYTTEIKGLKTKIDGLERSLSTGATSREEQVLEKRFFSQRLIQVFFGEEMIEERAMTQEEFDSEFEDRQIPLHGVVEEDEPSHISEVGEDIAEVIAEEQNPMKPTAMN